MTGERRRAPRVPVDLPARVLMGGAEHDARVKDICRDAALVECAQPAALGDAVALSVALGRASSAHVKGRVIRLAGGAAFAVLFSDLDPAAATEIEVLLQRLERESGSQTEE